MKFKHIISTIILFSLISCGNHEYASKEAMMDYTEKAVTEEAGSNYEEEASSDKDESRSYNPKTNKLLNDQKLIKTANIVFETDNLTRTRKSITHNLDHYGAYISNESLTENNYRNSQHISIQVPVNQFDKLIDKIGSGINDFDTKEINVSDVSSEFYDTKARIKSKELLESRMFEILKKAKTVKELLDIEYELSNIRTEIESMQGRLKYLTAKTSYSTIHLEFYIKNKIIDTEPEEEPNRFLEGFLNGWELIVSILVGLTNIWPLIILLVLGIFIFRMTLKKHRNKKRLE